MSPCIGCHPVFFTPTRELPKKSKWLEPPQHTLAVNTASGLQFSLYLNIKNVIPTAYVHSAVWKWVKGQTGERLQQSE